MEEYKRAAMPTALYCLLSAYALEAAALVYATIVNFGLLADTIGSCHTAEELARCAPVFVAVACVRGCRCVAAAARMRMVWRVMPCCAECSIDRKQLHS